MNAGRNRDKAIEQARANARIDGKPRFVWIWSGTYWVEKSAPHGAMASIHEEVTPDGCVIVRQPEYPLATL